MHWPGRFVYADGSVLEGKWKNDVFDTGTYQEQSDGVKYKAYGYWYRKEDNGEWMNRRTKAVWAGDIDDEGRPKLKEGVHQFYIDGGIYEGSWYDGGEYGNGQGTITYADGRVLTGTCKNSRFEKGTYKEQAGGEEYDAYAHWYKKGDKWINRMTKITWTGAQDSDGNPKPEK
jgi:hypothetical protein